MPRCLVCPGLTVKNGAEGKGSLATYYSVVGGVKSDVSANRVIRNKEKSVITGIFIDSDEAKGCADAMASKMQGLV